MVRVTAVIPQWNRSELLAALLRTCVEQTHPFKEIIVVDNRSSDDSIEIAKRTRAKVVHLDRNYGFATAVNRGIHAAGENVDWIAILNNDVTLDPRWLERILAGVGSAWFAMGKILRADDATLLDGSFDEISRGGMPCRCGYLKPDAPEWNKPQPLAIASPFTAALFHRKLFERVGTLDERFESYLEDVDFGLRSALAGIKGVYIPDAIAHHVGSATLGAWKKDTVRLLARNQVLLSAKHFRHLPRWPRVVAQLLWGLLAFRHGGGTAWLRGKLTGLRMARSWRSESTPDQREALRSLIEQSENRILEIQRQTGFDRYWRAYFWLLRR
jgi:GT2 family glycosyltransferase